LIAARTDDLNGAATDLRKSLEINPKHGPSHFVLAWVLGKQGKLEAARDEYRLALLYDSLLSSEDKVTVLRAMADINEKLPAK
jgi:Flp pilus assembly protein TadD